MAPDPIDRAIGQAIDDRRTALSMSQRELGEAVAHLEGASPYPQSTVSGWISGDTSIRPARLFLIEKALGVPAGSISHLGGFVPVGAPSTVQAALDADELITEDQAEMIQAAYETARARTRARRLKRQKR